jgi:peptidyl-prolyl cis-trans isomerase B (cyclophilin B)
MKQLAFIIALILLVLGIFWLVPLSEKAKEIKVVTFETTMGPIVIELFEEDAPITTKNFLDYANSGFYDGTLFHRVVPGFVIQGGGLEPRMQEKAGNPPIENEANNGQKNLKWSLSMARTSDPNSATSQFFINLENNTNLDHTSETPQGWGYAVFGTVIDGFETVEAIASVSTGSAGNHQEDVPLEDITVQKTRVTKE